MEKKLKKQKNLIMILIIISLLFIIVGISSKISVFAENSNISLVNTQETIENIMYDMTNGNYSNDIDLDSYCQYRYAQNATIKWGTRKQMQVLGDDDIVDFIPKQLFKTIGKTQFVGKKYGFFIDTIKPFNNQDLLLSTVILIKITYTNNMLDKDSVSHLKIKVTPVFQADFVCLNKNDTLSYSLDEQDYTFFKDKYLYDVHIENLSENEETIVPVPTFKVPFTGAEIFFSQHNKFYLTNASNVTSLYNVNDLNPFDNGYNANNDMGCFFTQTSFNYNGSFIKKGGNSLKDAGEIAFQTTTYAFDLLEQANKLKSVFKAIPVIGQIVNTINLAQDISQASANLKDIKKTEEKVVEYKPMYNNKYQQIEETGGLLKDAAIAITSVKDNDLLFGLNDYFEFDYQLNCQDISVDTIFATMLNFGVVSVVNIDVNNSKVGELFEGTHIFTDEVINHITDGYKEIPRLDVNNLDSSFDINMLPERKSVMQMIPKFSGQYDFEFCNNNKFIIYEIDKNYADKKDYYKNATIVGESVLNNNKQILNNVILEKDKIYYIEFEALDNRLEGKKTFEMGWYGLNIKFVPKEVNLGSNNIELKLKDNYFKFIPTKNVYYSVYLNELNCLVKLLDKDLKVIEENVINEKLLNLSLNETYYILIDKTNCTEISEIDFVIKDKKIITLENVDKVSDFDKLYIHSQVDNTKLPEINIDGYIFDGWWTSLEVYGVRVTNENINDLINQPEATLYAKWTAIEYVVEYVTNGGSQIDNGKYIVEHIYELRTDTYKDGYVFYGWYDNQEFNGSKIEKIEKGSIGNKVYYAKWIKDKFIINLNVNSTFTDNIIANISETQYEVGYNQNYVLPVPEIKGFIFEGWVDINNTNNKFTNSNGESLDVFLIEKDIELIAKWKREEYFIGFDNNGKLSWLTQNGNEFNISNEKESIKYNPDLCPNCNVLSYLASNKNYPQTIDENFFKEGHIFTNMLIDKNDPTSIACWHTIDCDLEDGETIMLFAGHIVEKNFKLYLYVNQEQGKEPSYKKIFEGNYNDKLIFDERHFEVKSGYSLATLRVHNNTDEMYNGKYVGTQLEPGKLFYIFNSSDQTMPDLSIGIQQDGTDIYLEAFYEPNQYQVVLKADDKVECAKTVVFDTAYNTSNNNAFPISQKLGFDFKGWWTGEDGTGSCIVDENGNLVNNVWDIPSDSVLFAKFEYTKYLISFVLDGGDKIENPPLYYTMENSLELPTTKKYGYIFDGWNTGSEVIYAIPKGSTGNLVLTVNWKGVLTNIYNQGEYTIQDEIAIVDFSKSGLETKLLINVDTNVKEISFIGSYEKMINKTIYVFDRTQELTMRLKDVNIVGMDNRAAIYALNCMNLDLESVGINYLQSGNITSKTRDAAALTCRDIIISGDELYITGTSANAHSGRDGLDGDAGIIGGGHRPDGIMILYIKKLECYGGNGANGLTGAQGEDKNSAPPKAEKGKPGIAGYDGGTGGKGGRGGNGGYGILFWGDIEVAFGASVKGIGGNGGNGGDGGRGGNGSRGGEGGDAVLFGASGKDGGKGGDGGRGGVYGEFGKMGVGIQYGFLTKHGDVIDHYGKNGAYGEVGAGGKGGAGGLGGWDLTGDKRHKTGANGKDGLDGGWVTIG